MSPRLWGSLGLQVDVAPGAWTWIDLSSKRARETVEPIHGSRFGVEWHVRLRS